MFGFASKLSESHDARRVGGGPARAAGGAWPLIEPLEPRELLSGGAHHAHTRHVKAHPAVGSVAAAVVLQPPVVRSPNPRLIVGEGQVLHATARQEFNCVVASFDPLRELSPNVVEQEASKFELNATITWADGASTQGTLQWNAQTRRWDVCATHTYWGAGTLNFTVTVTLSPIPPQGQPIPLFGTRLIAFAESTAVTVDPPPPPVTATPGC